MVRSIRSLAKMTCVVALVLFAWVSTSQAAFDDDDKKDDKKQDKKEDKKKLEMPKLPEGSNPKWDLEAVEEKFTIVKGDVSKDGYVYFLVELKEDMATTPQYEVVFSDSDKVKYKMCFAYCEPSKGKKGDRVRLVLSSYKLTEYKDSWIKAVKVQIVEK